jgi:hypothetical protein
MSTTPPPDRDDLKRYLRAENLKSAGEFVNSALWLAIKSAMLARAPEDPVPEDKTRVQAAKSFKNLGWRACIEDIERLPFEQAPNSAPLIPETLTDQRD